MMYEREVEVPRLVASVRIGDADIPELRDTAALVEHLAGARFNSIGLNLYRDRRDSVAPHNDTLGEIAAGQPVALLSLGAARRMTIRSKALPRRVLDMDLEPGSVLIMSYRTQQTYDHGIPKTGAAVGPRISAAFRARLG
ncbi:MAG TPA: alpha-ketoglutarate-dependent dioxygenase AlkB [Candidatus Aquilonibacter sp.]